MYLWQAMPEMLDDIASDVIAEAPSREVAPTTLRIPPLSRICALEAARMLLYQHSVSSHVV